MEGTLQVTNPNQNEGVIFPTSLHPALPENMMVGHAPSWEHASAFPIFPLLPPQKKNTTVVVTVVEMVGAATVTYAPGTTSHVHMH